MNKRLLQKQFQWQKDNSNYISLLAILVAWGLGAGPAGIDSKLVFVVFSGGIIFLGFFMITSKWSEIKYEKDLFDKRKNNKSDQIAQVFSFLIHAWMGLVLIALGIYFLWIYKSLL